MLKLTTRYLSTTANPFMKQDNDEIRQKEAGEIRYR